MTPNVCSIGLRVRTPSISSRAQARHGHICHAKQEEPWAIGFQCNERYLQWGESGQARFLKIHCAKELGWSPERVEQELQTLAALLPGLELRFERIKADLLLTLLTQQQSVAENILILRRELPAANVAAIVAQLPTLIAYRSPAELVDRIQSTREALPKAPAEAVDGMIEAEPRILDSDVPHLLSEIERLLPGTNAQRMLVENPSSYMDMASQGLRPSLEDEPGIQSLESHSKG